MKSCPWLSLSEHLTQYREGKQFPLTLLAGAGIHNLHDASDKNKEQAKNNLSSWDNLLASLGGRSLPEMSQTMCWELLALEYRYNSSLGKPANEREKMLRKELQRIVFDSEEKLCNHIPANGQLSQLVKLLSSPCITDIISLNVDLYLERLINGFGKALPKPKTTKPNSLHRHRIINRSKKTSIRIWHPHGDRTNVESLSFGLWRYELILRQLSEARQKFKQMELKHGHSKYRDIVCKQPNNWFECILSRPLLIVGTSLNSAEWDIWYALLSRWRNFAKNSNQEYEPPIWFLTTVKDLYCEEKIIDRLPANRFRFLVENDWPQCWMRLSDIF